MNETEIDGAVSGTFKMRIILMLLVSLFVTIATAQQLPMPQFRTPADNDNSPRAATTAFVQTLLSRIGISSVKWFGAACNGAVDDRAVILATATAAGRVSIPAGCIVRVASNLTLAVPLDVQAGGQLKPDAGVTMLLRGVLDAPGERVIYGSGSVVGMVRNRPEWWGANPAAGNTDDSAPAINAALASAKASFSPGAPLEYGDGGRPRVELGVGFYKVCSPIHAYPDPATPVVITGHGVLNAGTRIDTCPTFSGGAMLQVHGILDGQNGSWEIDFRNFMLGDGGRKSTACVEFVPEGAGYGLNSGNARPSIVENVLAQDCPIGLAITNTLQMRLNRVTYNTSTSSNNVGVRLATAGEGPRANTGEMVFDDLQVDPCPSHNASNCTNTTGVQMRAAGNGVQNIHSATIAAIVFTGNTIFWGSNNGIDAQADDGAVIADVWLKGGTQFDGFGCKYVRFFANGADSLVTNIHLDHLYQTGTSSNQCTAHDYNASHFGRTQLIWVTNSQFVLGGQVGRAAFFGNAQDVVFANNIISGAGNTTNAVEFAGSVRGVFNGNLIHGLGTGARWSNGIAITGGASFAAATGNVCANVTGACVSTAGAGANVVSSGANVGP